MELSLSMLTVMMALLMWLDRRWQKMGRDPGLTLSASLLGSIVVAIGVHAVLLGGWTWALKYTATLAFIPYLIEAIGVRTGIPFGKYDYHDSIGPRLPLGVPVAVAGTWPIVLYCSTIFAQAVVVAVFGDAVNSLEANVAMVFIASVLTVVFDLIAEPISVKHGYWRWDRELEFPSMVSRWLGKRWFGIPTINFVGWWLTALITVPLAMTVAGDPQGPEEIGWWWFALPIAWGWASQMYAAGAAAKFGLSDLAKWSRRLAWFELYAYLLLAGTVTRWFCFEFIPEFLRAM